VICTDFDSLAEMGVEDKVGVEEKDDPLGMKGAVASFFP
jgi:hypothetical protein